MSAILESLNNNNNTTNLNNNNNNLNNNNKIGNDASAPVTGDYYFDSYSHYGIHMEMLKDFQRTSAYRDAILMNKYLFKDKIVLDVGCGTGILSLFAAKAGAKKVIGIDCSSVADQAKEIIKDNNYDNIITIIRGKVEEIELEDKVDIIISEWMGYFLLYESMLNTVLHARDKFGSKNVKLFPSHGNMYISGITDRQYVESKFDIWENIEGINFSYFKRLAYIEPLIDSVDKEQIITTNQNIFSFNVENIQEKDLSFTSPFSLQVNCDEVLHALVVYFDTPFLSGHNNIILDTSPFSPTTHWKQTVLYLYNYIKVKKGDIINGILVMKPNKDNPRDLDISLRIDFDGEYQSSHFDQDFRLR